MGGVSGARWQTVEQLHVTLAFLGDLPDIATRDLTWAAESIRTSSFELAISGVGHFERKGRPSAIWAGLSPSQPLKTLQERVVRACRKAGYPPDAKTFRPHITLARLPASAGPIGPWLAETALLASPPWHVTTFSLFESRLHPQGSTYRPLEDFELKGS